MSSTSARVLELLTLLQSRRHWSGAELARRLEVSPRTLRRDVESLQDLGYPISTTRGTGGGYQLAPGGSLPPLVLGEDEAAAVTIALREMATGEHPAEAAAAISALAKIVQVLPARIRRRVDALRHLSTLPGPAGPATTVDATVATTLALAARDHENLTFEYVARSGEATTRHVEPHHVASVHRRLYLVAHDLDRADWRVFRIDRVTDPRRTGRRFAPRPLPAESAAEFVRARTKLAWPTFEVVATIEAPAAHVEAHVGEWGSIEDLDGGTCRVRLQVGDLDWAVFALACLDAPFTVHGSREAVEHVGRWAGRLSAAVEKSPGDTVR